jgi:histidine triad (HIT) family protein
MSRDCIFCQIIRKEAPANVVYENEQVVAFLSNRPVNEGHTLVVPKKHYVDIYDIPEDEVAYLYKVTKRIAVAVKDSMTAEGIRVVQNNGWAAGQVVFHLHVACDSYGAKRWGCPWQSFSRPHEPPGIGGTTKRCRKDKATA